MSSRNRRARAAARVAVACGACIWVVVIFGSSAVRGGEVTCTWVGGPSGTWSTPSNWSYGYAPNNGHPPEAGYNVIIDDGSPGSCVVSLDMGATILNLTIGTAERLDFANDRDLTLTGNGTLSTLSNAGTINLNGPSAWTDLRLTATDNTINGGGTIVLNGYARLLGGGRITNVNNTITGDGYVGDNGAAITNQGTISATHSGLTLVVDPSSAGMINSGTLLAANQGILHLSGAYGGNVDNTGGILLAEDQSCVVLSNGIWVSGGTLHTIGSGTIGPGSGHSAGFSNISNTGNLVAANNTGIVLDGTITNSGSINLTSAGAWADLSLNGATVTLGGAGAINLGGANARLGGTGTLLNQNNTIRGEGYLGANNIAIVNQAAGLISSDLSTLRVDTTSAGGLSNAGIMQAANGAILQLTGAYGGGITNTGTIQALNGSWVQLVDAVSIDGGVLTTAGNGSVGPASGHDAFLSNLTNAGNLVVPNNAAVHVAGALHNSGSINLLSGAGWTDLRINGGTLTLDGAGTVTLSGGGTHARILGSGTLLNVDNHIHGEGYLGANNIGIINGAGGQIVADVDGHVLRVDPVETAATDADLLNQGEMVASNGGILQFTGAYGGAFTNQGNIRALDGSTVQLIESAAIIGGALSTAGTGSIRTTSGHSASLVDLTLAGHVVVEDNATLYLFGSIANTGSIDLNAVDGYTTLSIVGGTITLGDGGTVNLNSGNVSNSYARVLGSGTLVNVNNTFRGEGYLGWNNIAIVNHALGVIRADVSGKWLVVDPSSDGMVNTGTMQASNGGGLALSGAYGGAFNNAQGRIEALAGSSVQLSNNVSILNGALSTSGSGSIGILGGHAANLTDLSTTGHIVVPAGANLNLYGQIVNSGSIDLSGVGNWSDVYAASGATVTLSGGGIVNMNGEYSRIIGSGTWLNVNNVVRGQGNIGWNNIAIVNQYGGTISADITAQVLTLDPNTNGLQNEGTLQAVNGGILRLTGDHGGSFLNTSIVRAEDGSEVQLVNNATISGGTWSSSAGGVIRNIAGTTANLSSLTLAGHFIADNNTATNLSGGIVNRGSIDVVTTSTWSDLRAASGGTVILSGGGAINLIGPYARIGGTGTLQNADNTIQGNGFIGCNAISVLNQGTILASGGRLELDPAGGGGVFVNTGLLRAAAGGTLQFSGAYGGAFDSSAGLLQIDSGGTVTFVGDPQFTSGNIISNGSFDPGGIGVVGGIGGTGIVSLSSGSLTANYIRQSALYLSSTGQAIIKPNGGDAGTSRLGLLSISDNARLDLKDNDLVIDYAPGDPSPLATVKAYILSAMHNGAWDGPGLGSSLADGSVHGLGLADNTVLHRTIFSGQTVDDTAVLVKYTFYGDANLDGQIDVTDLGALATHWQTNAPWTGGDFNYDGFVDVTDLGRLATNWQAGVSNPLGAGSLQAALAALGLGNSSVPEPSLVIAAAPGAVLLARRRRWPLPR